MIRSNNSLACLSSFIDLFSQGIMEEDGFLFLRELYRRLHFIALDCRTYGEQWSAIYSLLVTWNGLDLQQTVLPKPVYQTIGLLLDRIHEKAVSNNKRPDVDIKSRLENLMDNMN